MKRTAALVVLALLVLAPLAYAIPVTLYDGFVIQSGRVGMRSDSLEFRSSGSTGIATVKFVDSVSTTPTITYPSLGANYDVVGTQGTQTIAGAKTFSTPPTITGGLTAANIQSGSAKRQLLTARLSPETGVAADSTVYRGMLWFGRPGTVTRVTYGTHVDPVSGTNVIKVLKAAFNGNTMLSTASVSLNGTTADTGVQATLTSTGADLGLTAAQAVCLEYDAGTQGTDAEQVYASVEFEPTDF